MRRDVLLVIAAVLSACTEPDVRGRLFRCESDDDCRFGHVCREQVCRSPLAGTPDTATEDVVALDVAGPSDTPSGPDLGGPDVLGDVAADVLRAPDVAPDVPGLAETVAADVAVVPDLQGPDVLGAPDVQGPDVPGIPDVQGADVRDVPDGQSPDAHDVESPPDVPHVPPDVPPDVAPDVAPDVVVCDCAEGVCCDGCRFAPATTVCLVAAVTESGCPEGSGCGSTTGVRHADRFCSGASAGCDGSLGPFGGWQVVAECGFEEACNPVLHECATLPECACGAVCDDEDACTVDGCDASGGCLHDALVCTDAEACREPTCVPSVGCVLEDVDDGTVCEGTGRCRDGVCCHPACDGRVCGPDGCGATCGACDGGEVCDDAAGLCRPETVTCNLECPTVAGYAVACNSHHHCEYTAEDATGWRARDVLVYVPPASFPMGHPSGEPREQPEHVVTFPSGGGYFIDRYEVTSAAFADLLTARGENDCDGVACLVDVTSRTLDWTCCAGPATVRSVCQAVAWAPATSACDLHPMQGASWQGARAFCAWRGARLCTEAEYERAAKGTDQRLAPWEPDGAPGPDLANCRETDCADGFERTAPVGSFPNGRSPVGADDLAGNAWEWVEDDWHDSYAVAGRPDDGTAWIDAPRGGERVLRGGGAGHPGTDMTTFNRWHHPPQVTSDFALGFRCCR